MAYENTRNYQKHGGSTWVVTGVLEVQSSGLLEIESGGDLDVKSGGNIDLESGGYMAVASGGYIAISSGGYVGLPVVGSTSAEAPIPNFGICTIRGGAANDDTREIAQPTRAGLVLTLIPNSSTTIGINVCAASATSLADCTFESSGVSKTVWEIIKQTTQKPITLVSANTSQWFVIGPIAGTLSTDGTT